jgi:hypothetical protein
MCVCVDCALSELCVCVHCALCTVRAVWQGTAGQLSCTSVKLPSQNSWWKYYAHILFVLASRGFLSCSCTTFFLEANRERSTSLTICFHVQDIVRNIVSWPVITVSCPHPRLIQGCSHNSTPWMETENCFRKIYSILGTWCKIPAGYKELVMWLCPGHTSDRVPVLRPPSWVDSGTGKHPGLVRLLS